MTATNSQLNSFTSGLNMDSDVAIIPDSQYRYAENIRVITNDNGTTGAIQDIESVRQYTTAIPKDEIVIGTTTIDKFAVIVTKMPNGYIKVYRVTNFDTDTPVQKAIFKGNIKLCQDLDKTPNISIVGNYETDSNIKVYFTDGLSAIKVLNIVDDKYTAGSNLVDSGGNILNPLAIDVTPGADLLPFSIVNITVGNLPSGVVQYCYQLFNLHSSETTLSPLSQLIHLTQSSTNQNSQQYMGSYPNTSSGKACIMEVPFLTKDFTKCRIISIRYTSNNSIPKIVIVDEIDVPASQNVIRYIDTGNSFMGEISIDEFNNLTGYQFTAATLTKMQNRLFAADITDNTWNPGFYDARAYRANRDGAMLLESSNDVNNIYTDDMMSYDLTTIPENHDCINPSNDVPFTASKEKDCYVYGKAGLGGYGINIEYNFTTTSFKLSDKQNSSTYGRMDKQCSMNVKPEVMSSATITNIGFLGTDTIKFEDTATTVRIPNYADPYISSRFKGYQRDEVYRFGIIFYNSKGLPSPVYWIGDIKMPHATQIDPFRFEDGQLVGKALGLRFTVKNMPDEAVSYEIVRCDRTEADRTILMQCVGTRLNEYRIQERGNAGKGDTIPSSLEMRPFALPDFLLHDSVYTDQGKNQTVLDGTLRVDNYIRLISPEICVQKENVEAYLKDTAYLDYLYAYVSPIDRNGLAIDDTRVYATANKILQSDGTIATIDDKQNYVQNKNNKLLVWLPRNDVDGNEKYYHANIAKYFNRTNIGTQGQGLFATIMDAKYPLDIPYNAFHDISAYRISVGDRTYTNYAVSCVDKGDDQTIVGAAGPCVIAMLEMFNENKLGFNAIQQIEGSHPLDVINTIPVYNIRRSIAAAYGGNTYASRQNSVYISTNSYVNKKLTEGSSRYTYTYGGDTFLNVLDYPFTFTFQANDEEYWRTVKRYVGGYIPFESSINMNLFNGDMPHRTYTPDNYLDSHMQLNITQKGSYHVQDRPFFVYNSVYSSQMGSRKFVPNSIYAEDNTRIFNRILVSQAKINNEILDSWTTFRVANYLDVDNQYGAITNLKAFKDKLFYWQDTALGIAAVNERSLITDGNAGELTLGTGGLLSRFDYVTNTNGSSITNDRSIINSDNVLYWYDFDKNEICSFTESVAQLSKEKQVQTYLNKEYPLKSTTVLGLFDKKYNEVWFKFTDKSLIFNEQLGRFTSFYTFNPQWSLPFSDKVVTIKDNSYYTIGNIGIDSMAMVDKNAQINFVVNKDIPNTKVFDNMRLSADFKDGDINVVNSIVTKLKFSTKGQTATVNEPVFDYREDTFRLAIPRQDDFEIDPNMSYPARMRGKYMECQYNFTADSEKTFKIPHITTTYRYSLV